MKVENKNIGISFWGALQVAFIVLKLCHVINWSWGWVLAPTLFGIFATVIVVILAVLISRGY